MKNIQRTWWLLLLGLSGLWFLADTLWPEPFGYFPFRAVFMQYSGVIAIGVMSVAIILATRPRWLEKHFNGLDKMYRLHKWLGITALVVSVVHWWWAQGTRWMVGWGWLVKPARKGGPPPDAAILTLEDWFRTQKHFAESVGEWAFYGAAALMVLALIKRFPYRWFAKTHTLIAVAYLALAFHTVVLTKYSYWSQPIGWVVALLTAAGVVSAIWILLRQVGAKRKVTGTVLATEYFPALRTLRTTVELTQPWPGHQAGQFAFVTVNRAEGAHPYTMASAWDAHTKQVTFVTKGLGDHTNTLHQTLHAGDAITVEGPYGCFTFEDQPMRQIWIGGGIGITPFMARLQALAQQAQEPVPEVDLYYTTADFDANFIHQLQASADAARVRLHVLVDAQDGLLTGERIRTEVAQWHQASVWFCGPAGFGQALQQDFAKNGFNVQRHFHQELFAMR